MKCNEMDQTELLSTIKDKIDWFQSWKTQINTFEMLMIKTQDFM